MRLFIQMFGCLCLIGSIGLFAFAVRPAPPMAPREPTLMVEPAVHDFGEIEWGTTLTTQFRVTNQYPVPVEVTEVSRGCSCSKAELEPRTIPPGGTAELSIGWSTAGKRGRTTENVSLTYTVGGKTGYRAVRLLTDVVTPVEPDREVVELYPADGRTAEVGFRSRPGRTFRLLGAGCNHDSLTAAVLPDRPAVRVTFDPAKPGWESGQLMVSVVTDLPDMPELTVPVYIQTGRPQTPNNRGEP